MKSLYTESLSYFESVRKWFCPILILLSAFLLLFLAVRPIFTPYLVGTADGLAHKYRLVNFDKALTEGIIRPRWIGDAVLGYGAPLYIFNYSVPYYLVDAIYRLGFSIQTSSQIYAAVTILLSAITMYLLVSRLWGRWAGVVAAIVYTFAPYHLITVYSYEGWGEMLAFVFAPLILRLLYETLHTPVTNRRIRNIWYAATVFGWVLFILTHNISSFIMSPVILLIAFLLSKRDSDAFWMLVRIAVSVVMTSGFFLLPAVTLTGTIKIPALLTKEIALRRDYMIPLVQEIRTSYTVLFGAHIGYKEFTAGVPIIGVFGVSAIMLLLSKTKKTVRQIGWAIWAILGLSLFFVDPLSDIFYAFRPLQYVLYPYRFLFLATFSGSLLTGFLFRKSIIAGVCIIALAVIFGYPFTHPYLEIFPFPALYFSRPQMLGYAVPTLKTMGTAEFLPKTADIGFLVNEEHAYLTNGVLPKKFIVPEGAGTIVAQSIKQESLSATIQANRNLPLTISTLYYPSWRATLDGNSLPVGHDRYGRIVLSIPNGLHSVHLNFSYTTIEVVGMVMSLCGTGLFVASLFL